MTILVIYKNTVIREAVRPNYHTNNTYKHALRHTYTKTGAHMYGNKVIHNSWYEI